MDELLKIMKALSDETRLKIIDYLLHYDFCVGALSKNLGISEAAVSQHLQVLRRAGLVIGEKRGYYTHYDIKRDLFDQASKALRSISTHKGSRKGCRQHLSGNHSYCLNLASSLESK